MHNILDQKLPTTTVILLVLSCCVATYGTQIMYPSFNADDIIQIQPIAHDYNNFLAQGRWGYFLVFRSLLGTNPGGLFVFVLGMAILSFSAFLAATFIGLRHSIPSLFFMLFATISLYYASLFSFDSTRLAYPIANLLSLAGLSAIKGRRTAAGIILLSLAPAIYPASFELAGTVFLSRLVFMLAETPLRELFRTIVLYLFCFIAASLLYFISLHASVQISGIPLNGRSSIHPLAALSSFARIRLLFIGHSVPFLDGWQMPYFTVPMKILSGIIYVFFMIYVGAYVAFHRGFVLLVIFFLLVLLLVVSPYSLAFFTLKSFPPRSLFPFGVVFGLFSAMPMTLALRRDASRGRSIPLLLGLLAISFITLSGIAISSYAFDEYLASKQDLWATNRIISRIDHIIAHSKINFKHGIPIAVDVRHSFLSGPRGIVGSARTAPWSRAWIFRLVDRRFVPTTAKERRAALAGARSHDAWPAANSVYINNGAVVVILR